MPTKAKYYLLFSSFILLFNSMVSAQRMQQNSNPEGSWQMSLTPTFGYALNSSSDSVLFRGNGLGIAMRADYYFGEFGLGVVGGFQQNKVDGAKVQSFMRNSGFLPDQFTINSTPQQNMYFLAGPSFRTGSSVELGLHVRGGLFLNNAGSFDAGQPGGDRSFYRTAASAKSIFPGFLTGGSLSFYPGTTAWKIGLSADYMYTSAEVNNYDIRRGGGMEAKTVSQTLSALNFGITFTKNFASGLPTGRRQFTPVRASEHSGLPTGRRQTISNKSKETSGLPTGRRQFVPAMSGENGGDTNPKHSSRSQDTSHFHRGLLSGKVLLTANGNGTPIITNRSRQTVSAGTANYGTNLVLGSHENGGSGLATGKRSGEYGSGLATGKRSRDAGSGMPTGRRLFTPIFNEEENTNCLNCPVVVKALSHEAAHVVQQRASGINPLYESQGNEGTNPLYQGSRVAGNGNLLCGTTNHLIADISNEYDEVIASTVVEPSGDFWFANLPFGNYSLTLSGDITIHKVYEVEVNSDMQTNLSGLISWGNDQVSMDLNGNTKMLMVSDAGSKNSEGFAAMVAGNRLQADDPIRPRTQLKSPGVILMNTEGKTIADLETDHSGWFTWASPKKGKYLILVSTICYIEEERAIQVNPSNSAPKRVLASGPIKWMAPESVKANINTSRSNKKGMMADLDEVDIILNNAGMAKANINTSRSNTKGIRDNLDELDEFLANIEKVNPASVQTEINKRLTLIDIEIMALQENAGPLGNQIAEPLKRLKTKHDTVKNSISNVR